MSLISASTSVHGEHGPSGRLPSLGADAKQQSEAALRLELQLRRLERQLEPDRHQDASQRIAAIMAAIPRDPPPVRKRRGLRAATEAIARWLGTP